MEEYKGYLNLSMSDDVLAELYATRRPPIDMLENQYLIVRNKDDEAVDYFVCKEGSLVSVRYQTIKSEIMGEIKPRNPEQILASHMLHDKASKIKILGGGYGAGKDYLMLAQAISLLNKGKFQKIVFVRNNIPVRDTADLGALPGTSLDKLLPFLMPFADHLGSKETLLEYIENGMIEPIHLGHLRGRNLVNTLIYCTEAQNLSVDHLQLLIGRICEGTELWLNGDSKAQVDKKIFQKNSGLRAAIECLKGEKGFAYVHLIKSERSPIAALADKLDKYNI